jgi:hypothetical protein
LFAVYTAQQAGKVLFKRQNHELRQNVAVLGRVTLWYLTGISGRGRHPV